MDWDLGIIIEIQKKENFNDISWNKKLKKTFFGHFWKIVEKIVSFHETKIKIRKKILQWKKNRKNFHRRIKKKDL